MKIPFIGQEKKEPEVREIDAARISNIIPQSPPGNPPQKEIVEYVTKVTVPETWKNNTMGFDFVALSFMNTKPGVSKTMGDLASIHLAFRQMFSLKDNTFNEEYKTMQEMYVPFPMLAEIVSTRSENAAMLNRVLASTNIQKTEIQAGGIQREAKRSIKSALIP